MWYPNSWKKYSSQQLPTYQNIAQLEEVENILAQRPALVDYRDIDNLKKALSLTQLNQAFVIQLGDCAERFNDSFNEAHVLNFHQFIKQAAAIITNKINIPVIKIGRIAGQFAKPRSNLMGSDKMLTFRGEIINDIAAYHNQREPDPWRMLIAYFASRQVLQNLENISHVKNNAPGLSTEPSMTTKVYVSHEALLLNYEASLTKEVSERGYYNLSTHMVWLGARTSKLPSPHVEYLKGINNPIGIKVHKDMTPTELLHLTRVLNPLGEKGKIILIFRLSNSDISQLLPKFLDVIKKERMPAVLMCDPMHGNTTSLEQYKVRFLQDLIDNIRLFMLSCRQYELSPGGIHLEATYDNVTECIGENVAATDIHKCYKTACDPRLNNLQTLEIIAKMCNFSIN